MKKLIFVLFLVLTGLSSEAQNDLTTQFSQWDKVPGARYIPSALDMKNEKVEIGFGGGFWLTNNFVNYDLFSNVIQNGGIDSITMSDFISKAGNNKNIIGAGLDGNLFQIAVKAKAGSKDLYILGGIASRTGLNLSISETLLELAWKGNKQFAGKTVELGPFGVNAWTGTEYSLGLVGHNLVESGDFNLSVAGKLKLITSSFALYMEDTKATMYTDPDGRFIDLNFNYNIKILETLKIEPLPMKNILLVSVETWDSMAEIPFMLKSGGCTLVDVLCPSDAWLNANRYFDKWIAIKTDPTEVQQQLISIASDPQSPYDKIMLLDDKVIKIMTECELTIEQFVKIMPLSKPENREMLASKSGFSNICEKIGGSGTHEIGGYVTDERGSRCVFVPENGQTNRPSEGGLACSPRVNC